jgi:hypothetical protein
LPDREPANIFATLGMRFPGRRRIPSYNRSFFERFFGQKRIGDGERQTFLFWIRKPGANKRIQSQEPE